MESQQGCPFGKRQNKCTIIPDEDQSTILQFANENSYLLLLSQDNPRRRIQLEFVKRLNVQEVPDKARVLKLFDTKDLSFQKSACY